MKTPTIQSLDALLAKEDDSQVVILRDGSITSKLVHDEVHKLASEFMRDCDCSHCNRKIEALTLHYCLLFNRLFSNPLSPKGGGE